MDIVRIGKGTLASFELILTEEALEKLSQGATDTFALGAIEDGMPVGAVAVICTPPAGRLCSLYVVEEYRKRGIGSALCFEALQTVMIQEGLDMFVASFSEQAGTDVFRSFFESMFFEIEESGTDYTITVGDALDAPGIKKLGQMKAEAVPYSELLGREKKLLLLEDTDLSDYVNRKQLREDLSYVLLDEGRTKIKSCIVFAEDRGELVLVWAHSSKDPASMIKLTACVVRRIGESEEPGRLVHLPAINEQSTELLKYLLGDRMQPESRSYQAVFSF